MFDRRPILTQFADKYEVRKYVEERIGPEILPKLYYVTTNPSDIPFEDLPDKFVVKPTHGSGWVRMVTDKSAINTSEIIEQCNRWLSLSFYKITGEWIYKNITPRIIIEEYIEDGSGLSPTDYKFFTYNGVSHFIQVNMSRFEGHKLDFYDTQWNRLPIKLSSFENNPTPLPCPPHFREMLTFSHMLGEGMDFVRIDFYDTSEKVYLGEVTATPGNGMEHFHPPIYNRILGEPWKIRPVKLRDLPETTQGFGVYP